MNINSYQLNVLFFNKLMQFLSNCNSTYTVVHTRATFFVSNFMGLREMKAQQSMHVESPQNQAQQLQGKGKMWCLEVSDGQTTRCPSTITSTTYAKQLIFTLGLYVTSAGVCVSRWCKDSCDHVGVIPAGLLQLDTVQHLFIRPQQTTACIKRPSVYRNDHQKTRSHHTGVSTYSSAPCYCLHSVQNRTADIQDTHYPSTELHTRPTPAALLVTTTQVRQSQPAWNSADENQFRSMQLHLQCFTHLEQSTSHHHWQLGRHCEHFQNEIQNVLLPRDAMHSRY